jgi:cephalosporin-C deacetylase-like acetyl esterase
MNILSVFLICGSLALAQEPLDVAPGLGTMLDDYLIGVARPHWEARSRAVAKLRTPAQVQERQRWARAKFIELLGGLPEKTPLNVRVSGTLPRDGYRIEKIIFESLPRYFVTANVYVPAAGRPPFPAVLGTMGHYAVSKAEPSHQKTWAGLALRGFVVLVFDPICQGERSEYFDPQLGRSAAGIASKEHTLAGLQALLTGRQAAGYLVWDGIRAFDYLASRPDVDATRIAVTGSSGGGNQASFLALFEPRLAASAPSCWMTSTEKLFAELGPQDAEQNIVPMLPAGLGIEDFPLAMAPRPFLYATASRDFFPIIGAHSAYLESRRIYEILSRAEAVGFFENDDTHSWSLPRRQATIRWFQKWLNNRPDDDGAEPNTPIESVADLNCTPTGQVSTSLHGETMQSMTQALAEKLAKTRPDRAAREIAPLIKARLNVTIPGAPTATAARHAAREGYVIEKLVLRTEPGITVPALAFVPAGTGRKPAVLYVDSEGKAAGAGPTGDLAALARLGYVALGADLRGTGESALEEPDTPPHSPHYKTVMRALQVGKPLPGMQVTDLLAAFQYLRARADVDPARIAVLGKHNGGIVALYAAALEPRVQKVACEGAVSSYLDIARTKMYRGVMDILVPAVLKDFDIPDVVRSIAPRPVWIVDPRTAAGDRMISGAARARTEATAFEQVYGDWLRL